MTTAKDLLKALRPGGNVYLNRAGYPQYLTLHKTDFIKTVKKMDPAQLVAFEVRNPDATGHWERPRRCVIVR